MKLSIIIVNYRSWDCLEHCLESLAKEAQEKPWETIVIDNDSSDGQLETFKTRFPDVQFRQSPGNFGFAFGCNQGAAIARGETLLFLNPDVVVGEGSVAALLDTKKQNPDLAILSCGQLDGRGRQRKVFDMFPNKLTWFRIVKFLFRRFMPRRYPDPRAPLSGLVECDWVSGSVFMIDRSDFELLDGWREDYFMYVEDCDFCLRAQRRNKGVACAGDVWMTHYHGGASRKTYEISVLTRTETIVSKHLYAQLNFRSLDRFLNHLCIFLAIVPKLLIYSIIDMFTFRQIVHLRTRGDVFTGLVRYYLNVMRAGSWRSPRLQHQLDSR